ncbi:MAG: SpoIIE family protein phosphatase [Solirubrobacterales bacterium]
MQQQDLDLRRYLAGQRELSSHMLASDTLEQVAPEFLRVVVELLERRSGALWEAVEDNPRGRYVCSWPAAGGRRGAPAAGGENALELPIAIGPDEPVLALAEFRGGGDADGQEPVGELLEGFAVQLASFIARRRSEAQMRSAEADAERLRRHFAEVVRGSQDAVLSKDLRGFVTSWNPAAERLYGYSAAEAIGRHISFIVPADHKNEEMRILDRIRRGEKLETYETDRVRADGARISISLTVSPILGPGGELTGASVIARDVTGEQRRRKAKDFLLAASRVLDSSLDFDRTARTIVDTAVPQLGELCVLDFLRPDGTYGDSVVAGVDPEMAARLEAIRRAARLPADGSHPVAQVMRAGRPMIWRDLKAPEVVEDVAQSHDHRQLMDDAGYNSAAVVGLVARGRTIGAISFLHARDERYDAEDLEFLAELGARAALVLDNARLYRERDEIARNLQRGLRPPRPADVPGLDLAVVFEAAGEGIEIGGDVYDVLPTDDGCWVLVADVAGKGSAAAGVSVALRHAVRGLTREIDEPEDVLARVNELLLSGRSLNDFATAVLARLRREGDGWRVALASAGHPPAIHLHAGGHTKLGGGTVLGGWEDAAAARHDLRLGPDETLVVCTDGWLEAGQAANHADAETLARVAGSLADRDPAELTTGLAADAVARANGELRDDLIVLALRPAP